MSEQFTTAEAGRELSRRLGVDVPTWKVRRVADSLEIEIQRFGPYRVLSRESLDAIEQSLIKARWSGGGRKAVASNV